MGKTNKPAGRGAEHCMGSEKLSSDFCLRRRRMPREKGGNVYCSYFVRSNVDRCLTSKDAVTKDRVILLLK